MTIKIIQGDWNWDDIKACSYCDYGKWVGSMGPVQVCINRESPYYDSGKEGYGTRLTEEQSIRGCENIKLDFVFKSKDKKIPAALFSLIPKDSYLRTLPLEDLVEDPKSPDLTSDVTVQQITNYLKGTENELLSMLKKYGTLELGDDGNLVPSKPTDNE